MITLKISTFILISLIIFAFGVAFGLGKVFKKNMKKDIDKCE